MADDRLIDWRKGSESATGVRACPWCQGSLVLQPSFPLRLMIPGDARARVDEHIPEALRTIRAWVCSTPHCKFRETAF